MTLTSSLSFERVVVEPTVGRYLENSLAKVQGGHHTLFQVSAFYGRVSYEYLGFGGRGLGATGVVVVVFIPYSIEIKI